MLETIFDIVYKMCMYVYVRVEFITMIKIFYTNKEFEIPFFLT